MKKERNILVTDGNHMSNEKCSKKCSIQDYEYGVMKSLLDRCNVTTVSFFFKMRLVGRDRIQFNSRKKTQFE